MLDHTHHEQVFRLCRLKVHLISFMMMLVCPSKRSTTVERRSIGGDSTRSLTNPSGREEARRRVRPLGGNGFGWEGSTFGLALSRSRRPWTGRSVPGRASRGECADREMGDLGPVVNADREEDEWIVSASIN